MEKTLWRDVDTDEVVEMEVSYEECLNMGVLRTIERGGRTYQRYVTQDERIPVPGDRVGNLAFNRPLVSRSAGVHSSQAGEFNEAARRDGNAGVYYDPKTGNAHFESRAARRKELKRRGMRDNDGGYGDG